MNVSILLIAKKLHISPQTGVSVTILTVAKRREVEERCGSGDGFVCAVV